MKRQMKRPLKKHKFIPKPQLERDLTRQDKTSQAQPRRAAPALAPSLSAHWGPITLVENPNEQQGDHLKEVPQP